mmetsp:Transcript_16889/g.23627  ORF Transcript_16889/g.23627 Transcript_16889/m.23627 type:complete len:229 (+) Transcript_16889:56-742(+)
MSVSPEDWFHSLPPVTKVYLVGAVLTTACTTFGIIGVESLYLDFGLVYKNFQIWRLVTCFFFFGKFSYPFIFQMYILGRYFNLVESEQFKASEGKTGDMVFLVLFGASIMLIIAFLMGNLFFLGPALSFMILYVWSRSDPMRQLSFWGFAIEQWKLPFVMLLMALLMQSSPVLDIVGIIVGHLWHFLTQVFPEYYGYEVIRTPQFISQWFDNGYTVRRPMGRGYRLND